MSNVVYLADSGRATTGDAEPATKSTNGRVWRLEFDPRDPTKAKLSVLVQGEGDDNPVKTLAEIHQPDNLETTRAGGLLVQEDPSSAQQFALTDPDPRKTAARISGRSASGRSIRRFRTRQARGSLQS
jgi:secreted PhoX family phosphatase